jgi:hypothetical protein
VADPLLRTRQAYLGGFEFPAGDPPARVDIAAPAERPRGVGGQVTGHLGQVITAGATKAHRPRQGRGGRLGQVAREVQARLLRGFLVVERLHGVAAPVHLHAQPRGLLAQRVSPVLTVDLDVQQGQAWPASRDAYRGRVHAGRQAADDHRLEPGRHAHRAAALYAGAVSEDRHARDRRVKTSAFRHPPLLFLPFGHRVRPSCRTPSPARDRQ